ncbi:hypothetical protein MMC18_006724 [Xylographa bjoerkii]|nr:hypothetical protein [Xylographa bjoerkii]
MVLLTVNSTGSRLTRSAPVQLPSPDDVAHLLRTLYTIPITFSRKKLPADCIQDAGHVSFPGGKADTLEETPVRTARREALEEIGLPSNDRHFPPPFQLEHLCELPSYLALTELGVRPCVALLHTGDDISNAEERLMPRLEPKEVAAIFSAPLPKFLSDRDDMGRDSKTGSEWYKGFWGTWFSTRGRVHQFSVPRSSKSGDGAQEIYKVFGMTARMILDTARLAYAEDPSFEYEPHVGDENVLRKLLKAGRLSGEKSPGSLITSDDVANAAKL